VAELAEVEEEVVEQLEAGTGEDAITIGELLKISRTFFVPPEAWDQDYIYDDGNRKKPGSKNDRDQWGGDRPEGYKKHFHRHIKPHLRGTDTSKIPKEDHDEWQREWGEAGGKLPNEITRPMED